MTCNDCHKRSDNTRRVTQNGGHEVVYCNSCRAKKALDTFRQECKQSYPRISSMLEDRADMLVARELACVTKGYWLERAAPLYRVAGLHQTARACQLAMGIK